MVPLVEALMVPLVVPLVVTLVVPLVVLLVVPLSWSKDMLEKLFSFLEHVEAGTSCSMEDFGVDAAAPTLTFSDT